MFVSALFGKIDIHLIAHEKLMTSVAKAKSGGVGFIAVAQHYAMKGTANEGSNGICGTITDAAIEHFSFVRIDQTTSYIGTIGLAVCAQQH